MYVRNTRDYLISPVSVVLVQSALDANQITASIHLCQRDTVWWISSPQKLLNTMVTAAGNPFKHPDLGASSIGLTTVFNRINDDRIINVRSIGHDPSACHSHPLSVSKRRHPTPIFVFVFVFVRSESLLVESAILPDYSLYSDIYISWKMGKLSGNLFHQIWAPWYIYIYIYIMLCGLWRIVLWSRFPLYRTFLRPLNQKWS